MTDFKKVFVDTAPFIYFLDDNINFGNKTKNIFEEILNRGGCMETSVLTCEEYLIYPYKTNNNDKIAAFFNFIYDCDIRLNVITETVAEKAAKIRAAYKDFKAMDSLQLAAACINGCDLFLTNDKQLRQFNELKCIIIDEWQ